MDEAVGAAWLAQLLPLPICLFPEVWGEDPQHTGSCDTIFGDYRVLRTWCQHPQSIHCQSSRQRPRQDALALEKRLPVLLGAPGLAEGPAEGQERSRGGGWRSL